MEPNDNNGRPKVSTILVNIFFWVIFPLMLILAHTGCTSVKEVEVPVVHTDTLREVKIHIDSTYVHDSIYVTVKQHLDTVYTTKHITHYRDRIRLKTDTVYQARVDTVTKVQYVEKEKRVSFMQRIKAFGEDVCILLLLLFFIWCCYKLIINNKRG